MTGFRTRTEATAHYSVTRFVEILPLLQKLKVWQFFDSLFIFAKMLSILCKSVTLIC